MDLQKLQLRLIELSKDPTIRESLSPDTEGGLTVLASTNAGQPALSIDWTWFLDQLPTLIPMIFSVISSGGAVAFVPLIVQVIMKLFNISRSQAQLILTQAMAATQEPG